MATYQSDEVKYRQVNFHPFPGGQVGWREAYFKFTSNPAEDDIVEMIPLNPEDRVLDWYLIIEDDINSHASANSVLAVGDGGDNNRYGSVTGGDGESHRMPDAGSEAAAKALTYHYDEADTLDVTITSDGSNFTAAQGAMRLRAYISSH